MKCKIYYKIKDQSFVIPGYVYGHINRGKLYITDSISQEIIPIRNIKINSDCFYKNNYDFDSKRAYSEIRTHFTSEPPIYITRSQVGYYPDISLNKDMTEKFIKFLLKCK